MPLARPSAIERCRVFCPFAALLATTLAACPAPLWAQATAPEPSAPAAQALPALPAPATPVNPAAPASEATSAAAPATAAPQPAPANIPAPPELPVKGYILVDFHSGAVLAEREADTRLDPASLTKIMTVYTAGHELAAGHIKLTDTVTVSEAAWKTGGSRMFIQPDLPVTVDELLHGIAVQSGNDACHALAEHTAGSLGAFSDLMNADVARLGLSGSRFSNPHGLPDPETYTTARDMAQIARALIRDYPDLYALFGQHEYTYNKIKQPNRNKLLYTAQGADGVKTGHTEAAGFCLVGSAKRDDMRLVSVVMGADGDKSRTEASRALLEYGFRFYETHRLYAAGQVLQEVPVWMTSERQLPITLAQDLHVTVPRGQYGALSASMEIEPRLVAPLAKGAAVGKVRVSLGDRLLIEQPVVLGAEALEGGFLRWLIDSTLMLVY